MATQIQNAALNKDHVIAFPAKGEFDTRPADHVGTSTLQLSSHLHTTLELDELITRFTNELNHHVKYDGITYEHKTHEVEIALGKSMAHSCNYQLTCDKEDLGQLTFSRRRAFTEKELGQLEDFLCALVYPLRNALLYYRATQSAMIDTLTGVKNRSGMEAAIEREIELAHRHGTPMSILLLDIDYFKAINDKFGHACGDFVIQSVAQCITETVRGSDMIYRFGGEEFLVLLSSTDCQGACLLAERIRENTENLVFSSEKDLQVTASLGLSCLEMDDTMDSMFKRADQALYQAKKYGRNQVITG